MDTRLTGHSRGQTGQVLLLLPSETEERAPDVAGHLVEGGDGAPGLLGEVRHGPVDGGGVGGPDGEADLDLQFSTVPSLVLARLAGEGVPPEIQQQSGNGQLMTGVKS